MSDLYARQPSWTDYLPAEWQSAINRSPVVNALTGYLNRRPSDIEGASNKIFGQPGDREAQDRNWLLQQAQGPSALERMNPVAQDGANKLMLLANFFGPGVKLPPAAPKPTGIRAYHGSPHDFDKFDISKIGTGEGAQAYGRGLYFAESEGVARSYRDALAPQVKAGVVGEWVVGNASEPTRMTLSAFGGNIDEAIADAAAKATGGGRLGNQYRTILDELQGIKSRGPRPPDGRMYEVNIKADPDQFLDWDKPLSQQPEGVRKALAANWLAEPEAAHARQSVGSMYDALGVKGADSTKLLRDAGIPGIKYLDQGSRVAGQGSRNYVVFDDKLIEILRKYGLLPPVAAGTAAVINQQEPQL